MPHLLEHLPCHDLIMTVAVVAIDVILIMTEMIDANNGDSSSSSSSSEVEVIIIVITTKKRRIAEEEVGMPLQHRI